MNNNIIVITKKSRPYKYVTWDRITMIFKPNYNNIFHPTDINIEKCEVILSQGRFFETVTLHVGAINLWQFKIKRCVGTPNRSRAAGYNYEYKRRMVI